MSKPNSGHFRGTTGCRSVQRYDPGGIIEEKNLDTREHPTKYKQLSSKKLKTLREKFENRTITKAEYKQLTWQQRLTKRRNKAITDFWNHGLKNNIKIFGFFLLISGKTLQKNASYREKKHLTVQGIEKLQKSR